MGNRSYDSYITSLSVFHRPFVRNQCTERMGWIDHVVYFPCDFLEWSGVAIDWSFQKRKEVGLNGKTTMITTTRCLIRPFERQDIESFMIYRNDLDWMKDQSFKGLSFEEYENALIGAQSLQHGMQLAIIDQATDELIGDVYIQQEGMTHWIGYTISPTRARQGYAFEVMSELIRHLTYQGAKEFKAGVLGTNAASIALLKKLNFTFFETELDEQIYRLDVSNI